MTNDEDLLMTLMTTDDGLLMMTTGEDLLMTSK
jgi:hypothetical protein